MEPPMDLISKLIQPCCLAWHGSNNMVSWSLSVIILVASSRCISGLLHQWFQFACHLHNL